MIAAGVQLVEFDMGLLTAEGAEVEAELLLAYEAPREVARCAVTNQTGNNAKMPLTVSTHKSECPTLNAVLNQQRFHRW